MQADVLHGLSRQVPGGEHLAERVRALDAAWQVTAQWLEEGGQDARLSFEVRPDARLKTIPTRGNRRASGHSIIGPRVALHAPGVDWKPPVLGMWHASEAAACSLSPGLLDYSVQQTDLPVRTLVPHIGLADLPGEYIRLTAQFRGPPELSCSLLFPWSGSCGFPRG
ncbi:hypothetical protein [Streptomyces sp. NPDC057579]|uniref:hypothetical protein n=1 Tax=Streptomyces sp. NPDC057579 TaxID=3346172 RepID=UPI003685DAB0